MAINVNFAGFAINDAEVKTSKNGNEYVTLTLGVSKGRDELDFVNVTAFSPLSKVVGMVKKGSRVLVGGQLNARAFVAKDGTAKTALDVVANSFEFIPMGPRKKEEGGEASAPAPQENKAKAKKAAPKEAPPIEEIDESEIPF